MKQPAHTSTGSQIRLTAFFVLILTLLYLRTSIGLIVVFLLVDFGLRAFNRSAFSPLANLSRRLARILHLPAKPVYMPPKRFAARIGFGFFIAIVVVHYSAFTLTDQPRPTDLPVPPAILLLFCLTSIIVLFAALESLANFCAGCYVYSFLIRLRRHQS